MIPETAVCSRCLTEKPFDAFHKNASHPKGRHLWCKVCIRKHGTLGIPIENDHRLAAPTLETDRHCRTCRKLKAPEEFDPLSGRQKGRKSQCRECYEQRALFKLNNPVQPKISYPKGYGKGSRLLRIHHHMRARCNCPTDASYKNYGGRGIAVCQQWLNDYVAFLDWALSNGYADDLTIERIDNDGPYAPENCRWTTQFEQARNTRHNRFVTAWGETKTLGDWAEDPRCLMSRQSLRLRLNKGISPEEAMTRTRGFIRQNYMRTHFGTDGK